MQAVINGDSLEVLKTLESNSVDSCVTDPPYELGFMGKHWDNTGIAYSVALWQEVYRVLKPGGHLLAFGGTRTYHRMACAIEDAGFEIRDQMQWLYGSGFPKSHDISKAIDKNNGEHGRLYKFTEWMRSTGVTAKQLNDATDSFMGSHYLTDKSQPAIPTKELWEIIRPLCGDVPLWVDELVERIAAEREVIGERTDGAKNYCGDAVTFTKFGQDSFNITAPATPAAIQWQGWGTALKPANEPICVARKPFNCTVAENVLQWGTGAINVDAGRIETSEDLSIIRDSTRQLDKEGNWGFKAVSRGNQGRWPANVLLDEEAAKMLDEQSGELTPSVGKSYSGIRPHGTFSPLAGVSRERSGERHGDSGGASLFFYVAKASKREREAGLSGFESQRGASETFDASNRDGTGEERTPLRANHHPTVKPIKLMEYLVKLVTPPNGIVLDPFAGSGTTGCACAKLGFGFIGIEKESKYKEIAEARIKHFACELA